MGYLSGSGEVIVKGASELTGAAVGTTAKIVNDLIDSIKGKVLVLDEAYALANSIYGKEVLDTLVERVQGSPGEDFAVILCGYEDEMRNMLRTCNPGLSRRFRIEDAFHFADYNDDELVEIMQKRAESDHLHVSKELARKAVVNVLAKQRAKANFGNVGAVNNLLNRGKERMMQRADRRKKGGRWVLVESDLYDETDPNDAFKALSSLVNADKILEHIEQLQKRIKGQMQRGKDPKTLLKNYCFVGPPGTGKVRIIIHYYLLLVALLFIIS